MMTFAPDTISQATFSSATVQDKLLLWLTPFAIPTRQQVIRFFINGMIICWRQFGNTSVPALVMVGEF